MKRFQLASNNLHHHIVSTLTVFIQRFFSKTSLLLLATLISVNIYAQQDADKQAEYKKAVTERVAKIVNTLGINDTDKYQKILSIIANQYFSVNTIHEESKTASDVIKAQSLAKDQTNAALKVQDEKKAANLLQQHAAFITLLKNNLTDEQVDKVKDGMTYSVFPITYAAYQDMLPNLTKEQKEKIYGWLNEARELAMDAESSDKKHAVFGKYKGRINNYLSAAGVDMKKEGEEWQKRIKERDEKAKTH